MSVSKDEEAYKKGLAKCSKGQLIEAVMRYRKISFHNGTAYYKLADKFEKIKEMFNEK